MAKSMGAPGWVVQRDASIRAASMQSSYEQKVRELEKEISRLRDSRPACKCQNCGSEFPVRPVPSQDSVSTYAERLLKVVCFKCGADAGRLTIIP